MILKIFDKFNTDKANKIVNFTIFLRFSRSVHTSYGFFLAICSLGDALNECNIVWPAILYHLDKRISMLNCFFGQALGQTGNIFAPWNMLFISCDRLFAVCYPFRYFIDNKNKWNTVYFSNPRAFFNLHLDMAYIRRGGGKF